jgi:tetratricopeptide (TPR) repeat protein
MLAVRLPCPKHLVLILAFSFALRPSAFAGPKSNLDDKPSAAEIKKLIEQLGSSQFSEREVASKRLQEIGELALPELRKAATESKDLETRRRAKDIVSPILDKMIQELSKEAVNLETITKDYKKAAILFEKVAKIAEERYRPDKDGPFCEEVPVLSNTFLHLARIYQRLEEFEKAGNAFHFAGYYSKSKRDEINEEWSKMTDGLLAKWEKTAKVKFAEDPGSKKLADKYPLILLHSRRYAFGNYLRSAYSFIHETSNEKQHGNDVQVLFDNDRVHQNNFQVRMVTNQRNRVIDLGNVEFDKESDPTKLANLSKNQWCDDTCKAVEGNVYLEKVLDDRGNDFWVVFKVIVLDPDSRYIAFIWRRLPGGKLNNVR